jgi:hypothetical protein
MNHSVSVSCLVKLVVSDLLLMNHEFMEYMRAGYPDTPLSEFKTADTYVHSHGGFHVLDDDEDDD